MEVNELENCLSRTLSFIDRADGKSNIQLATCGILLAAVGVTLAGVGSGKLGLFTILAGCLSILLICFCMVLNVLCVYPRLVPQKQAASKIYFDTAATLEGIAKGCVGEFLRVSSNEEYKEELIGQIIENNRVAQKKYKFLVGSSRLLIASIAGIAICLSIAMVGALK